MGFGIIWKLPWTEFEPQKIEASAAEVAAAFPGLSMSAEGTNLGLRCFFVLSQEVEEVPEAWTSDPYFEEWTGPGHSPYALPMQVEFCFSYHPPDEDTPEGLMLLDLDRGKCWNRPLWNLVSEILGRFCEHWGNIQLEMW